MWEDTDTDDATLDALVAERGVDVYDGTSIVHVPRWAQLNSAQKSRVCAKVETAHAQLPLDAAALGHALFKLLSLTSKRAPDMLLDDDMDADVPTPPLDPTEFLAAEAVARSKLEADGGLPCYPTNVLLPDPAHPGREVPEEYREIIQVWTRSDAPGYGRPALTQLRNWETWRRDQAQVRGKHKDESFCDFVAAVRRRRRQFGVAGEVRLEYDLTQQSQLDNLVEYQDFHFRHHERLQRDLAREEEELKDHPHDPTYRHRSLPSQKRAIEYTLNACEGPHLKAHPAATERSGLCGQGA
ncbi:hypothetical protein LTR17_026081 [Elasticomyces elasticus]|nr:hypothetical protein LTR17_026081 [Elasticomyces elasticus]